MTDVVWRVAGMVLFPVQAFHLIAHIHILCRLRLLPRKDLLRVHLYFFVEGASSLVALFFYAERPSVRLLMGFHGLAHLYYFFFWEKIRLAKRIVNWSCLDWFQSPRAGDLEMDNVLAVLADVTVHVVSLFVLGSSLSLSLLQIVLLLCVAKAGVLLVMYNPRLAWASPSSMPAWVQKRIRPLPPEKAL